MGGIINVITKDFKNTPKLTLDLSTNSYQEINSDFSTIFKLGHKVNSLLSVNYFHFDKKHDINNDNFTDLTLSKRFSIFNKWSFKRLNNREANIAIRYINENRYGGELEWEKKYRGTNTIYGESIYINRYEVIGNYQLPIKNQNIMFNFSMNKHIQDSYYGDTKYYADQEVYFNQLTWNKKISDKHDMLFGLSHRYTIYDDNTGATEEKDEKTLIGGFIQSEFSANSTIKVLTGLRYDYNNEHGNIFSPRFGIKYKLDDDNDLRLNIGNGFRIVNVFSEDHAALIGGRDVVFNSDLSPEKSWNVNLNYTRFQSLGSGFVYLDFSAFYTYYNNRIIANLTEDTEKIIYDNLDGYAENYGVSLNTTWTFSSRFKVSIGGTYLESFIYDEGNKEEQIQTPRFTGNYSISYALPKQNIMIDFSGVLTSSMYLPVFENDYRPNKSPFYNLSNIQLTKKWNKGIELYLGVKNLFNFHPKEDVILRAFDPFDKNIGINNPNGYTFDPSYNYAPIQKIKPFLGLRVQIK